MISANDLAAMQAQATASLDTPCVVQRKTRTADGYGSATETDVTITTVNANLAQPTASQMQNYAYIIGEQSTWQVRLPAGTDVRRDDKLVIAGQTLVVQVVLSPKSYATAVRVLASEVR